MDAEGARLYLRKAKKTGRFNSLKQHPDFEVLHELLMEIRSGYDTVSGIKSDKEWVRRQGAVEALDTVIGTISDAEYEMRYALDQVEEDDSKEVYENDNDRVTE